MQTAVKGTRSAHPDPQANIHLPSTSCQSCSMAMSVLLTALVWAASLTQKADAHVQVLQELIKCRRYFLADFTTLSSTLRNGCCRFFFLPAPSLWLTLPLPSNCPQLCFLTTALTLLGVMMAGKARAPLPFTWLRVPLNLFPSGTPLRI